MPPKHIRKLAIALTIPTIIYIGCAYAITTSFYQIATFAGFGLVLIMTIGLFYATLHLSKAKAPTPQLQATDSDSVAPSEQEQAPSVTPSDTEEKK